MRTVLFALTTSLLIGCASFDGDGLAGSQVNYDPYEARSFYDTAYSNESLKFVDLLNGLDPKNVSGWRGGADCKCNSSGNNELRSDEKLACALNGFYSDAYKHVPFKKVLHAQNKRELPDKEVNLKFRSNRLQDRLFLASNQACDDYKRRLLSTQSSVNFAYGNMAVLTGGLGAIFTPPSTSRALSGASAIITGSRAEYNNSFFRKLLAEVITRGIAEERDTLFKKVKKKQTYSIQSYSVEQALADAVQYNAKCSLIAGLENAQKAQSFYSDPGLERMSELFDGETKSFTSIFQAVKALDSTSAEELAQNKLVQVIDEKLAAANKAVLDAAKTVTDDSSDDTTRAKAVADLKAAQVAVAQLEGLKKSLMGRSPDEELQGSEADSPSEADAGTSDDPRESAAKNGSEFSLSDPVSAIRDFPMRDNAFTIRDEREEALSEGGNN